MLNSLHLKFVLVFIFVANSISEEEIKIIEGGGYTARICLNHHSENVPVKPAMGEHVFSCRKSNETGNECKNKSVYSCPIPSNLSLQTVKIGMKIYKFSYLSKPKFELAEKNLKYNSNGNLTIRSDASLRLLAADQINIDFSANVSCSRKYIQNYSVICALNFQNISLSPLPYINITLSYGRNNNIILLGSLSYSNISHWNEFKINYSLGIPSFLLFFILTIVLSLIKLRNIQTIKKNLKSMEEDLQNQKIEFSNNQMKAFLEYQTAVNSFSNLGKLSPRFVLTFNDYVSRLFNVEFEKKISGNRRENSLSDFEEILLNEDSFLKWIGKIESQCQTKQRGLVASLVTLVLFQHPAYFLDIMKVLLVNLISQMKINGEEKLLFRRTEGIIEIMIGNWISLLMYPSLRVGEVGERLFNLCRALKCKMESGLVDVYANKAKHALVYDNLLFGELENLVLTIVVDVHVNLKLMDSSQKPLDVSEKFDVDVLSLDSISQVKLKILDKAIMEFTEKENLQFSDDKINYAISKTDSNDLTLKLVTKTNHVPLEDLDYSTVIGNLNGEYTQVNTLKHYGIKSGMQFLLTSVSIADSKCIPLSKPVIPPVKKIVHLQMPVDFKCADKSGEISPSNMKLPITPINGETNKESYLMHLLGTKKSLSPFIDGFFQSLTNNKPLKFTKSSTKSLFLTAESQITDSLLSQTDSFSADSPSIKDFYATPIYYLFSILDDIAKSQGITDDMTIQVWKSNSFVLRFWINIIKNPNFIFAIEKSYLFDGCLTTVASILMESCSSGNKNVDLNSPIIKQLFLDDVKEKYSIWWQSFLDSAYPVNKDEIAAFMNDTIEKNDMKEHYFNNLRSLVAIDNLLKKHCPAT